MSRLLFALAVLPAFLLLLYIRRLDRIETEPAGLVAQLCLLGGLTTVSAVAIEAAGGFLLRLFLPAESTLYKAVFYFVFVAGSEELGKFVVMRLRTWRCREFNFTYDAVVYAVSVSLGFAVVENVLYVFSGGFGTVILRALTALPGHTMFAIFMGLYYGRAKYSDAVDNTKMVRRNLFMTGFVPIVIHGFYDFSISLDGWISVAVFCVFYLTVVIYAFTMVRQLSHQDTYLYGYSFHDLDDRL